MKPGPENPLKPQKARIDEKIQETEDTYSLKISPINPDSFFFQPGQFNMLGFPGLGEAPISFSSLKQDDNSFFHTVRLAGNVTQNLCAINPGEEIDLRGPYGNGWPLKKGMGRNMVVVGGGIGIAPIRAAIYYLTKNRVDYGELFFVFGAKKEKDLLFKEELKQLKSVENSTIYMTVDRKQDQGDSFIREGLVTLFLEEIDFSLKDTITLACGPELMLRFVAQTMVQKGQDSGNIFLSMERQMKCGIAHCGHCQLGAKYICKDGPVFPYREISRFPDSLL